MTRAAFLSLALAFVLPACEAEDPSFVPLSEYETDLGEAIVREVYRTLPDVAPGIPKVFCIVKGADLESVHTQFTRRFDDLKVRFVSSEVLSLSPPENAVVEPVERLSPHFLQIGPLKKIDVDTWEAEGAWSYKKLFERRRYQVKHNAGTYQVTGGEKVAGNFEPTQKP